MQEDRLRLVLRTNALVSAACGLVMAAAANPLGALMHASPSVLRVLGIALFPFAAFVWLVARERVPNPAKVLAVSACDVAWVVGTVALAFLTPMSTLGRVLTIGCALVVEVFGTLQVLRLRDVRRALALG